ncbi:hypothetical protein P389DRAFT_66923 [Cystobasidium minutum MCA 4210]|uniref:uncharacterized protein n=1 Tax=Cystobasidium minutum MCA 4210 TaxID=1397322 RepID=UPI0034CD48B8|eukprot:jgi/Rhomi1/66923/CE66922_189
MLLLCNCRRAPLPTLACKSCTTCRDRPSSYCAASSSDPASCGVCDSDRIACPTPAEIGQVATCNNGQCGVACDEANSYFGPGTNCALASRARYVTCPRSLDTASLAGLQGTTYTVTLTGVTPRPPLTCTYRAVTADGNYESGGGRMCRYYADTGAFQTELVVGGVSSSVPVFCPASLSMSTTAGQFCYTYLSCAPTFDVASLAHNLMLGVSSVQYTSPTKVNTATQICRWQASVPGSSGTSVVTCTYDQITGQVITGTRTYPGGASSVQNCPPLRSAYKSYCLAD